MKLKFTDREEGLLIALMVVASLALAWLWVVYPTWQGNQAKRLEIQKNKTLLQLAKQMGNRQVAIALVEPGDKTPLRGLSDQARVAGLELQSSEWIAEQGKRTGKIELYGTYPNFLELLDKIIADRRRSLTPLSLEMTPRDPNKPGFLRIQFNVQ